MKHKHYTQFFVFIEICLTIFLLTALLAGCERKEPVKIGFTGCLTGRLSDLGTAGRNGTMLAVEQINGAGGINGLPVELLVRDDKNKAEAALKADQELIGEGVSAIIGHVTSSMCLAALPVINDNRIVMISPTASSDKLTGLDDYFFRVCPDNNAQTIYLARHTVEKMKLNRLSLVYDLSNPAYSERVYKLFRDTFKGLGGEVLLTETFTSGKNASYFDISERLLKDQPQGVFIVAGAMDTAMICQHLRKINPDLPIISSGWALAPALLQPGGKAVEGVIFSHSLDEKSNDKQFLEFKKQYVQRFGNAPEHPAGIFAYEAAQLLFTILAETKEPKDIKPAILKQKSFQGLQGKLHIDPFGDVQRNYFIVTVKDGEFITINTSEEQKTD
ncbi:ABC transporter substrate-binding protein [Desulfobacterales bacterium HSG17]|nr:ABC transporter substrate-binding protein [Desulfobacterales bacterium HSG17]